MVNNLDRALNSSHRQTVVIIMDFAKAFDEVPHRRLLYCSAPASDDPIFRMFTVN